MALILFTAAVQASPKPWVTQLLPPPLLVGWGVRPASQSPPPSSLPMFQVFSISNCRNSVFLCFFRRRRIFPCEVLCWWAPSRLGVGSGSPPGLTALTNGDCICHPYSHRVCNDCMYTVTYGVHVRCVHHTVYTAMCAHGVHMYTPFVHGACT